MRTLLPAALSLVRIPLAALFVGLGPTGRLVVLALAAASDGADGWAARRLGVASRTGGLLDTIGDKGLAAIVLVTLLVEGAIAPWQLPLLLVRDAVVVGLQGIALARRRRDLFDRMGHHHLLGKLTTAALFVYLPVLVVRPAAAGGLFVVAAALSFASALDYLEVRVPLLRRAGPDRLS